MVQSRPRFAARVTFTLLFLAGGLLVSIAAFSQTLPNIRTVFVPRNPLPPDPCFEFFCFDRASFDRSTLAAVGATFPAVYVFRRLSSGPWYAQTVLRNRTALPPGYDTVGYRFPVVVVGDDVFVTAFQSGPSVPTTCATHVHGRTGTTWQLKQVINTCAWQFAKDGSRVLFNTGAQLPIYVRGANGLYTEESRLLPPSDGFFSGEVSLALNNWTVVVGKPAVNLETGAAYIFQRRSGQWTLMETLVPEGAGANTRFGHAVAAYEYNVAIGAPGAVNPSGVGSGLVYMYTGVGDEWAISQEIAEPPGTDSNFGRALALRGRRLVVSSDNSYPFFAGPSGYLFERGLSESAWVARGTMAGRGKSVELSGNIAMVDSVGLRGGTFPAIVDLPALREPEVAP